MSKNYNRYGEESKKTDKYGMTRAAPTVTAIKTDSKKNSLSRNLPPGQTGT